MKKIGAVTTALLFSMAFGLAVAGCAGEMGGDDAQEGTAGNVSVRTSPLTADECRRTSVVPDVTASWEISFLSPRTYWKPNCTNAEVADLSTISSQFIQPGTVRNGGSWSPMRITI
jgi:hypothetical protein